MKRYHVELGYLASLSLSAALKSFGKPRTWGDWNVRRDSHDASRFWISNLRLHLSAMYDSERHALLADPEIFENPPKSVTVDHLRNGDKKIQVSYNGMLFFAKLLVQL